MWISLLLTFGLSCIAAASDDYLRVCYFTNWAQYRDAEGKFAVSDIDASLCTHIVYAFAILDQNEVIPFEWNDDGPNGQYAQVLALRNNNPGLKVSLAIGGWNHGTDEMTKMLATKENRDIFVDQSIQFLRERDFDGYDLDFEYPGSRGSPPEDKDRFQLLVEEFRLAIDAEAIDTGKEPLLLTMAVGAGKSTIEKGYHCDKLGDYLDYAHLMAYDLNGAWQNFTGINAPLKARSEEIDTDLETLNVQWAVEHWLGEGFPASKMTLGVPLYGRSFTLTDPDDNGLGAPADGPAPPGRCTGEEGFHSFYEICEVDAVRVWDEEHCTPYSFLNGIWSGHENTYSLCFKVQLMKNYNLAGIMMWSISLDDFLGGMCHGGTSERYVLMKALNQRLVSDDCPHMEPAPGSDSTCGQVGAGTTTTTTTTTTEATTTTTQATTTSTTEGSTTTDASQICPINCEGLNNGFVPHPHDCSRYCQCHSNTGTEMQCAPGTYWCDDDRPCCANDSSCY